MIAGSSNTGSVRSCSFLIKTFSRRRLRKMLSVTEVALRNFSLFSQGSFLTNANILLFRDVKRWLDSDNGLGDETNNCEVVGMPVYCSQLYNNLSVSNIIRSSDPALVGNEEATQSWHVLVKAFFSSQHFLLSSECLKKDPMFITKSEFIIILCNIGISSEDYGAIFSGLCFAPRSLSNQYLLRWGRDESDESVRVHLTYLALVLFAAASENVLSPNLVYKLMYSILKQLFNLVLLGGNMLVASAFLNILDTILSYNGDGSVESYIIVANGSCRSCNFNFLIASSCFQNDTCLSDFWNCLERGEAREFVTFAITNIIDLAPGENSRNSFLTACLDFFACEILTTFTVHPVIPATSSRGRASPCSLAELSLISVSTNNSRSLDTSSLNFIVGLRPLYSNSKTIEARRSDFVCSSAIDKILSNRNNDNDINQCNRVLFNLLRFMVLDIAPGPISPLSWISFIGFARRHVAGIINHDASTRTINVLKKLLAEMESGQGNKALLCRAFSLAVMFFLQEFIVLSNHGLLKSVFCFILRSVYENANNMIGSHAQMALEDIDNEFIVEGKVCLPN